MACTMRLASDKRSLASPTVKLGLIPGYGGTQRCRDWWGKGSPGADLTADDRAQEGIARIGSGPAADLIPRAEAIAAKIIAILRWPFSTRWKPSIRIRSAAGRRPILEERCSESAAPRRQKKARGFPEKRPAQFKGK